MDYIETYGIFGLFLISFLSATILPLSSEAGFLSLLVLQPDSWGWILCVATLGNALGAVLSYELARAGSRWALKKVENKRYYPKLNQWNEKYGATMGFFAFLPIIGDFIPVYLGLNKIKRNKTYFYLHLGKFSRYLLIIIITFTI